MESSRGSLSFVIRCHATAGVEKDREIKTPVFILLFFSLLLPGELFYTRDAQGGRTVVEREREKMLSAVVSVGSAAKKRSARITCQYKSAPLRSAITAAL